MTTVTLDATQSLVVASDFAGDDVFIKCNWEAAGVPVDMTGYTALAEVRDTTDTSVAALLTLTEADNISLGGTPYNIVIRVSAAQSSTLGVGTFFSSLVLTDSLGLVDTPFKIKLKLKSR